VRSLSRSTVSSPTPSSIAINRPSTVAQKVSCLAFWVHTSLASPVTTAFPTLQPGRLPHYPFRGLLSVHSHYGLYARRVTYMTLYTEGFERFVTSTYAPLATGWSD